jgi:hypothetical protein
VNTKVGANFSSDLNCHKREWEKTETVTVCDIFDISPVVNHKFGARAFGAGTEPQLVASPAQQKQCGSSFGFGSAKLNSTHVAEDIWLSKKIESSENCSNYKEIPLFEDFYVEALSKANDKIGLSKSAIFKEKMHFLIN